MARGEDMDSIKVVQDQNKKDIVSHVRGLLDSKRGSTEVFLNREVK